MIISKTPLRMSFVGGGSDFRDYYKHKTGGVISTTINKYVYITVNKRFSDKIRVGYSEVEEVDRIDDIKHNLVRESLKLVGGLDKGMEIVYVSDMLPAHEGSGLGASSAILVGTLNALHAYKGEYVTAKQLAEEACEIEIDILGHPIGKQDQYACAYGGMNHIQFNSDETVFVNPIIFDKKTLFKKLLLYYIGNTSRSDEVLVEQKQNTQKNMKILDEMVELIDEAKISLTNDTIGFDQVLKKEWKLKKQLAHNISNQDIDYHHDKALRFGASAGKILGSGGGGFLLMYCDRGRINNVQFGMSDLKRLPIEFEPEGSKIIYVG